LFQLVLAIPKEGTQDRVRPRNEQIVTFQALDDIVVTLTTFSSFGTALLGSVFSAQFVAQGHGTGVIFAGGLNEGTSNRNQ
jgi:hypothetical protein